MNLLITAFGLDNARSRNYNLSLTCTKKLTKKMEIYVDSKVQFIRLQNMWAACVCDWFFRFNYLGGFSD